MARRPLPRDWTTNLVKSTKDVKDKKLNILLWGPPGSGKTYFARTCPNPFIIATEDGVLTLHKDDIPYLPLFTGEYQVYDTIMKVGQAIKRGEIDCDTVYLDSEWKLNELLKEEILEQTGRDALQQQDWGTLNSRISAINNMFLQMDKHFVATSGIALKQSKEDEDTVVPTFNLQGSYKDQMGYEFDFNFYMEAKKRGKRVEFTAFTQEQRNRRSKTRVELPDQFVNPNMKEILASFQETTNGSVATKEEAETTTTRRRKREV